MKKYLGLDLIVFRFTGHYESDPNFYQERFVVANTEQEALEKIERYSKIMVKRGFDKFIWNYNPTVEIEYVID